MEPAAIKKGTERMTLRIDAPIMARLDKYHKETEIPKTRIINKALQNYLDELEEDLEDAKIAAAAWEEFEADGKNGFTLEDMRQKYGL